MLTNQEPWQNQLRSNKMITTENFNIEKTQNLSSKYIENELKKLNVKPLRWAIVAENEFYWIVSTSYEK